MFSSPSGFQIIEKRKSKLVLQYKLGNSGKFLSWYLSLSYFSMAFFVLSFGLVVDETSFTCYRLNPEDIHCLKSEYKVLGVVKTHQKQSIKIEKIINAEVKYEVGDRGRYGTERLVSVLVNTKEKSIKLFSKWASSGYGYTSTNHNDVSNEINDFIKSSRPRLKVVEREEISFFSIIIGLCLIFGSFYILFSVKLQIVVCDKKNNLLLIKTKRFLFASNKKYPLLSIQDVRVDKKNKVSRSNYQVYQLTFLYRSGRKISLCECKNHTQVQEIADQFKLFIKS